MVDTVIRVRRKRGAEPAPALMLSLKRARTDEEGEGEGKRVYFSLWKDAAAPEAVVDHRLIDFDLSRQDAGAVAPADANGPEGKENEGVAAGADELSFVSDDAIGSIGEVPQQPERKRDDDVIMCNGAPLQKAAVVPECDDVFDFYRIAHPADQPLLADVDEEEREWEIAVATRQEMLAYIGAMDGVEGESEPDSEDSNDENNWRNDYPDEESDDSDSDASGGDYDYDEYTTGQRRRRRGGEWSGEEYGSSDNEDTESDDGGLAENWRNFRLG